jgi:uncharacterized membrane protein
MKRFLLLGTALGFAVPLYHFHDTIARDWDYFNTLSLLVRSSVWQYHRFPLHDPWMCGGLDLLANPQARILSPLGLFDVIFPPHLANGLSLFALSVAGALGAFRLFRALDRSPRIAAVLALLFVNGSWFSLHFAEGHIPFGLLLLLPWIALCARHWDERRWRWLFAALCAGMVLSGAPYAFIFSLYFFATAWLVGWGSASFVRPLVRDPLFTVFIVLGAGMMGAAKLLPALATGTMTERVSDAERMPAALLARAFFSPEQRLDPFAPAAFGFHEYGCYLGVVALAFALRGRDRRLLVAAAFWLWAATGVGGAFNPWSLHTHLPLLGIARVQSRVLIIFFLLFLALLGRGLERLSGRRQVAALAFLTLESLAIRTDTWSAAYRYFPGTPIHGLITRDRLDTTVNDAVKPTHYLVPQALGSVQCYEPSFLQSERRAVATEWSCYRGEAWAEAGSAAVDRYTPGEIHLRVSPAENAVTINTNTLAGWHADGGVVESRRGELLRVRTQANEVVVRYAPRYWWWMWALFAGGLVFLLVVAIF